MTIYILEIKLLWEEFNINITSMNAVELYKTIADPMRVQAEFSNPTDAAAETKKFDRFESSGIDSIESFMVNYKKYVACRVQHKNAKGGIYDCRRLHRRQKSRNRCIHQTKPCGYGIHL